MYQSFRKKNDQILKSSLHQTFTYIDTNLRKEKVQSYGSIVAITILLQYEYQQCVRAWKSDICRARFNRCRKSDAAVDALYTGATRWAECTSLDRAGALAPTSDALWPIQSVALPSCALARRRCHQMSCSTSAVWAHSAVRPRDAATVTSCAWSWWVGAVLVLP